MMTSNFLMFLGVSCWLASLILVYLAGKTKDTHPSDKDELISDLQERISGLSVKLNNEIASVKAMYKQAQAAHEYYYNMVKPVDTSGMKPRKTMYERPVKASDIPGYPNMTLEKQFLQMVFAH